VAVEQGDKERRARTKEMTVKNKALAGVLLATMIVGALVAPAGTAAAKKKKKAPKAGPVVVATDPDNDWGTNAGDGLQGLGDALGQELTGATIAMADPTTVNFIISVKSLPSNGGAPEVSRYTWDATVDGAFVELDGKWSNYSRGACDPTSGQCPPPRDPGMQPFIVRGDCVTDANTNVTTCTELGLVHAKFDAAAKTITIPVPLDLIHGHTGSIIAGGVNIFGGNISAAPSAYFSSSGAPSDVMTMTTTFTVY
jgi:hypothetical protein